MLFQTPSPDVPTTVQYIDMVTGAADEGPEVTGYQVNGTGYNVLDDYVYGWARPTDGSADTLVRIGADGSVVELGLPAEIDPTIGYNVGDVDTNGHYWLMNSSVGEWFEIDLVPGSPTYGEVLSSGTSAADPDLAGYIYGADWAFVPGGGDALYRTMTNATTGSVALFRFDMVTHDWTNLGEMGPLGDSVIGAVYADADGFLYTSENVTGLIHRIDIQTATATPFADGPASSGNDGTRCSLAPIPIDFGDAPDSYGTTLADDGPRHLIPSYDTATNTAPLMLGSTVDIETDGFPSTAADGDDADDTADEDGVSAAIVAQTAGATTVSVTATNDTDEAATLAGWIDLDGSGTFDAGELVTVTVPAGSGTASYDLEFPAATTTASTYARFRLFPGDVADPLPTGSAAAGEVEDYPVQVAAYEVAKTSDAGDGSPVQPGQAVTYTISITNTGTADVTGVPLTDDLSDVLDDATLTAGPTVAPDGAGTAAIDDGVLTFEGGAAAGTTTTITYEVTVLDPAETDGNATLANVVTAPIPCEEDCEVVHEVESYKITKTTDPADATADPGDTITYTVEITNDGAVDLNPTVTDDMSKVLDDAVYNGDAAASSGVVSVDGDTLEWTGPLGVGATVTVTYSVTINDPLTGDSVLENVVTGTGPNNCPCGTTTQVVAPAPVSPITPGPTVPVVG